MCVLIQYMHKNTNLLWNDDSYAREQWKWHFLSELQLFQKSMSMLKHSKFTVVSRKSFPFLSRASNYDYFCSYLYTLEIKRTMPALFSALYEIFVIAEFNPFCRDCTIRHSGDETWNVLNMQHNPKFQKMELFRHPRWWPSHMCGSGHHLRNVTIPDERNMIKKSFTSMSLNVKKVPDWQILWTEYQYCTHCSDVTWEPWRPRSPANLLCSTPYSG